MYLTDWLTASHTALTSRMFGTMIGRGNGFLGWLDAP